MTREQRTDPRIPIRLRTIVTAVEARISVHIRAIVTKAETRKEFTTVNISRGGCFLETDTPYTIGDVVEIDLFIGPSDIISTRGKVAWVSYPHENSQYIPGMGIKFEQIDCRDRERLGKHLGGVLKAQLAIEDNRDYPMDERIIITSEDICDQQVEALVSFAGIGIRDVLSYTGLVIERGGDQLKKDYELYGGDLQAGDSFLTQAGGTLNASYVIHTSIPSFYDAYGEELLRMAIISVLTKASEQVFKTVAFPAFALFEIGFPFEVTARIVIATTYGFLSKEKYPQKILFACNNQDVDIFEKAKKEVFGL